MAKKTAVVCPFCGKPFFIDKKGNIIHEDDASFFNIEQEKQNKKTQEKIRENNIEFGVCK
jgi:uncharacterized Zn finger protein (UPF0148 family)